MNARFCFPKQRERLVIKFEFKLSVYRARYCFFAEGALAEIFLSASTPNSEQDTAGHMQTIRHALLAEMSAEAADHFAHALNGIDAAGYR